MKTTNPGDLRALLYWKFGRRRALGIALIIGVGIVSLSIRVLGEYRVDHSALLYVAVPYFTALMIMLLRPLHSADRWWEQYISHTVTSLTVFLASSIVLMEGFVCVVMFLPIYYGIVTLTFFIHWGIKTYSNRHSTTYSSLVPLLIVAVSLEGTVPALTIPRASSVSVRTTTIVSSEQLLANLSAPIDLNRDRHWILSVFPMPYEIESGRPQVGDVHTIRTRYHRWFVTNTHEGEMQFEILEATPRRVQSRTIRDTTYFATYLQVDGSVVEFREVGPGVTEITLSIDYQRKLDPAWYFHPLQRYAMTRMAEFLMQEVIIRD